MRYVFCAVAVSHILGNVEIIDWNKLKSYIRHALRFDGGIGQGDGAESHGDYSLFLNILDFRWLDILCNCCACIGSPLVELFGSFRERNKETNQMGTLEAK